MVIINNNNICPNTEYAYNDGAVSLTFENSTQSAEIHLIRAIEHHHKLAETSSHVLNGFSFTGSGGSCRGSPHRHP